MRSPQIATNRQGGPETGPRSPPAGDPPVTVVVAGGFDPGGGAGILRDVATATALGARVHAVGTAWTDQGEGVHRIEPRDPTALAQRLNEYRETFLAARLVRDARKRGDAPHTIGLLSTRGERPRRRAGE